MSIGFCSKEAWLSSAVLGGGGWGGRALEPGCLELRVDLICLFSAMSLVSRIPDIQEVLKKHLSSE